MMVALAMPPPSHIGLQAVAAAGALELVDQRGHEAGAGAAERMAEGDGATVDVDLVHVRVVLLLPRQHHGGERLVDLDEVHLVERHARPLQHLRRGRDRRGEHQPGIVGGQGELHEAGPWRQAEGRGLLLAHDEHRGRRHR